MMIVKKWFWIVWWKINFVTKTTWKANQVFIENFSKKISRSSFYFSRIKFIKFHGNSSKLNQENLFEKWWIICLVISGILGGEMRSFSWNWIVILRHPRQFPSQRSIMLRPMFLGRSMTWYPTFRMIPSRPDDPSIVRIFLICMD